MRVWVQNIRQQKTQQCVGCRINFEIFFQHLDPRASPKYREGVSDDECVEPPPAKRMKSSSSEITTDDEDTEVFENSSKDDLRNITVELEGKELWERFSELGTEMIITKAGRCEKFRIFE